MTGTGDQKPAPTGQRLIREYFGARNAGDAEHATKFLATDFVRHSPPKLVGIPAYNAWLMALRTMWADEVWRILDLATEGDRVWAWLTNESTHIGLWHGLQPTGRRVSFETVNIFRVRDQRIAEMWRVADDWSRFRQLGGEVVWPRA